MHVNRLIKVTYMLIYFVLSHPNERVFVLLPPFICFICDSLFNGTKCNLFRLKMIADVILAANVVLGTPTKI